MNVSELQLRVGVNSLVNNTLSRLRHPPPREGTKVVQLVQFYMHLIGAVNSLPRALLSVIIFIK